MYSDRPPIILKLNATWEAIHRRLGLAFPELMDYGSYLNQHAHDDADPEKLLHRYVKDFHQEQLLDFINELHDVLLIGAPDDVDFEGLVCDVLFVPRTIARRAGLTPRQLLTEQHRQLMALKPAA